MYDFRANLIIGFHGCDQADKDKLVASSDGFRESRKDYDWLGSGMYFWENNLERAFQWAQEKHSRGEINTPAVVGAVLQLGNCCDFLDSAHIKTFSLYYALMSAFYIKNGWSVPENKSPVNTELSDKVLRLGNCAVIKFMHEEMYTARQNEIIQTGSSDIQLYDSVRGVFTEGRAVFEGSGVYEKSHIQICVRNPDCIKGFFNPRKNTRSYKWAKP